MIFRNLNGIPKLAEKCGSRGICVNIALDFQGPSSKKEKRKISSFKIKSDQYLVFLNIKRQEKA